MMRLLMKMTLGAATILLLTAACASAQSTTRADALTPAGLERIEVRAPDHEDIAVRLMYAPPGQQRAEVWMDVVVESSPAHARHRAEQLASRVAAGLDPRDDVGEAAWGDRGMVVLARGSVAVAIRVIAGGHDALVIAQRVDAALRQAPAGSPGAPRLRVGAGQPGGAPAPIAFEGDVVAAHVAVTGDAYARRTRDGWVLVVTGEGPYAVHAFAVDSALRVHRLSERR